MSLIPSLLSPGDKISIIAPAGNINPSRNFTACSKIILKMGFRVSHPDAGWPGKQYLADNDEARAEEFAKAWTDPETKCIWALRGGYGSLRLIDHINFSLIERNPKYFIGFSDITILLNLIFMKTRLITIHGPVVNSLASADNESIARVAACLKENLFSPLNHRIRIVRPGPTVKGVLLGGNLCSIVSLLGTRHQIDFSGAILFLEDVNEPFYKIDRMLTQLSMNGAFENINGIVLGDFSGTGKNLSEDNNKPQLFVAQRLDELIDNDIPIWAGMSAGHCRKNLALPIGASAVMERGTGKMIFRRDSDDDN